MSQRQQAGLQLSTLQQSCLLKRVFLRTYLSPDQNCLFPFEPPLPKGMAVPLGHNRTLQNTLQKSDTIHQTRTHKMYGYFCSRVNLKGGLTGSTKVETCVMLSRAKGIVIQLCWNLLKKANPYNMQGTTGTRRSFWDSKENKRKINERSQWIAFKSCRPACAPSSCGALSTSGSEQLPTDFARWVVGEWLSQQNQWCNSYLVEWRVRHSVIKTQDVIGWMLVFWSKFCLNWQEHFRIKNRNVQHQVGREMEAGLGAGPGTEVKRRPRSPFLVVVGQLRQLPHSPWFSLCPGSPDIAAVASSFLPGHWPLRGLEGAAPRDPRWAQKSRPSPQAVGR